MSKMTEDKIRAALNEIKSSVHGARANVQTAEEAAAQAERRAGELRIEYDAALNRGDKQAMDDAIAAIADAREASVVDPAVYKTTQTNAENMEKQRRVLAAATASLREDARTEVKKAERRFDTICQLKSSIDSYADPIRKLADLGKKGSEKC